MKSSSESHKVDVLVLGPKNIIGTEVSKLLDGYTAYNLHSYDSIDGLLQATESDINPQLALICADKDTVSTCEWVQSAKMSYPHVPIIVLYDASTKLNHQMVQRNGGKYIMHLFYDQEFISDRILQLAPVEISGDRIPLGALVALQPDDFEPETTINFNLYIHLPSSQKTLLFRKAGAILDEKAIHKIKTSTGQRVYVRKTDLSLFFKYASTVLKQRNHPDPTCHTEKLQKAKSEIQQIITYFMAEEDSSYEYGKKILERCEVILSEFGLNQTLTPEQIFYKLVVHNGQPQTIYNDSVNLCAYATLFAKIINFDAKATRTAALAGLLANVGLACLPREIFLKPEPLWTAQEKDEYKKYPLISVQMVKKNKVPLEPEVAQVIEQHRELIDGSGFPMACDGTAIHPLAKLLAIAYRFQCLTSLNENRTALTPHLAIEKIFKENTTSGKMVYDPIMITTIHAFIQSQTQRLKSA